MMVELPRIAHLSTAHDLSDDRITMRQAKSLADYGFEVFVIAQQDTQNRFADNKENLKFINLPNWKSRRQRLLRGNILAAYHLLKIDVDLVHIHDPELMPLGVLLRIMGKKVIIDMHEDLLKQIDDKEYLGRYSKFFLKCLLPVAIKIAPLVFNYIVAATESIAASFPESKCEVVRNLPRINEFSLKKKYSVTPTLVVTGMITEARCLSIMLKVMEEIPNAKLLLAGPFSNEEDESTLRNHHLLNKNIEYLGILKRDEIVQLLSQAWVGLSLYQPLKNHMNARPAKIYEYMASETSILASSFEEWEKLICEASAGEVVEPNDVSAIIKKINSLIEDRSKVELYGRSGRRWLLENYSWESEEEKIIRLYKKILELK